MILIKFIIKNRNVIVPVFLIFISLAILTSNFNVSSPPQNKLETVVISVFSPFHRVVYSVWGWFKNIGVGLTNKKVLIQENKDLATEIKKLNQELQGMGEVALENRRLKKLLDYKEDRKFEFAMAEVIGTDSSNWGKMIIIDKGSKDKVEKGMGVVTDKGLVGRIHRVGVDTSQVLLLIDRNFRISVVLQRSRGKGIIVGTSSKECFLKYLPPDADIQKDDIVISSGVGGGHPKGLVVGKVLKVRLDKNSLFKVADVAPAVDFKKLEEVLVIKRSK